jgi:hypothetical protein
MKSLSSHGGTESTEDSHNLANSRRNSEDNDGDWEPRFLRRSDDIEERKRDQEDSVMAAYAAGKYVERLKGTEYV